MVFPSSDVFGLLLEAFLENVLAKYSSATRWEFRLDVQAVPFCFNVCTSPCHTGVWDRGRGSGGRRGRPGRFPALILGYFINFGEINFEWSSQKTIQDKIFILGWDG